MNPNSEIVIARALFVNIVLSANASVASKIIIGNCVNISIPTYVNIFIISNWLVLKLYSNTGTDRLSNPNTMPPTTNSINRIIAIANTVIINIVIYFDNNIFALLYGLINNNLTVPLLNSSLTIVPAIITIITIMNKPYSEKKFFKIPLVSFLLLMSCLFSIIYLLTSFCSRLSLYCNLSSYSKLSTFPICIKFRE